MTPSTRSAKTTGQQKPTVPQPGPARPQTEPTAGREEVREVTPVRAPRQSNRPTERTSKARTGSR